MIPVLFHSTETAFTTKGIGVLSDAISCIVTEERNGGFELEMQYPVSGIHFADIRQRAIILAKPSVLQDPQPFRIYRITKPLNSIITIYAEHISYDLSGIAVSTFSASSCPSAMASLQTISGWTFWTDKTTVGRMEKYQPVPLRSLLGGEEASVLATYGGEWRWDKFTCRLYAQRGTDNGVQIRYGKNLIDLEQDEACANLYTEVMCYYFSEADGVRTCISGTKEVTDVYPERTYDFTKTLIVDVSSEYSVQPTVSQLEDRAETYIRENGVGIPNISLTVSFAMLGQTEEYKNLHLMENVELCDTVSVIFEGLGVNASAKVNKTVYNTLLERYESISLGDAKHSIADTIVDQQHQIDNPTNEVTVSMLQQAVASATQRISGNAGGYIVLRDANADGKPDEILVMDTEDVATATKVWRWNKSGLGYSNSGINGPYSTAITDGGEIVADFITAGLLTANIIRAGVLSSQGRRVITYTNNGLTSVDENTYVSWSGGGAEGRVFKYNGSAWTYNGTTFNLATAGITYRGTPDNSTYIVAYDFAQKFVNSEFDLSSGELSFVLGRTTAGVAKMMCSEHGVSFYIGDFRVGGIEGFGLAEEGGTVTYDAYMSIYFNDMHGKVLCELNSSGFDLYNSSNQRIGGFWRNGNNSQIDANTLIVRNGTDMNAEKLRLGVSSNSGYMSVNKSNGTPAIQAEGESMCLAINGINSLLRINNSAGGPVAAISCSASNSAYIALGDGSNIWNIAKYANGRYVYADHFTFYGKSDGLINSGNASPSNCSAYIVYGQPTNGGYYSSIVIPSDIAVGKTWQLADESYYVSFTISNSGAVTKKGGNGTIAGIYYVR